MSLTPQIITDRVFWNNTLRTLPYAHILQTWEWGEFKHQTTGWQPHRIAFYRDNEVVAMASIGIRNIGIFKLMYAPKGACLKYEDTTLLAEVLDYLQQFARRQFAIWLKIDPDVVIGTGESGSLDDTLYFSAQVVCDTLKKRGWQFSSDQVQFKNTVNIDLTQDEETLLANMSGNTRRKVRVADKKEVTVREGTLEDLPILYDLYQITGQRDDFLIRPFEYYKLAWQNFLEAGLAHTLIAEFDGKPIAHVILFHFGEKCWYFYGASSNEERNRMPNYALQWEAMKWAKHQGYKLYDMWGAPDKFDENDRLWSVYEFKRGFRGTVTRHIGAWDYAPFPPLYTLYSKVRPRLLEFLRNRKG